MVSQEEGRRGSVGPVTNRKYRKADVEDLAALDQRCETGSAGSESLAFDLLGDPLCRVRHLPTFHMLVSKQVLRPLAIEFILAEDVRTHKLPLSQCQGKN